MKIQYFTFFLNPIEQKGLFPSSKSKIQILKDVLLSDIPIKFECRNNEHAIVKIWQEGNYAIFRLGKKEIVDINLPPEKAFKIQEIQNWPHILLFVNFDGDSNTGQKLAVQYKAELFPHPYVQLDSLTERLNEDLAMEGYLMSTNAITTKVKFWEIVEENENNIKKLVLSFNSPNLFNLDGELNTALKEIQKEYSATKSSIVLENPEGKLSIPHSELIKQGVQYITNGGGSYRLEFKKTHSSIKDKDNIETKEVIDLSLEGSSEVIKETLDKIFNKDA